MSVISPTMPPGPWQSAGATVFSAAGGLVRAPFAAWDGGAAGLQAARAGAATFSPGAVSAATWSQTVANFFRSIFGRLFFHGVGNAATGAGIAGSGTTAAIGNVVRALGTGGTLGRLGTALGACGPAGWILLGGLTVAGLWATLGGFERVKDEYNRMSDIDNEMSLDLVQSKTLRILSGVSGILTMAGGVSCLAALAGCMNPAMALGIVATGMVGSFACNKAESWMSGLTWWHTPETAPWAIRWAFRNNRSPGVSDPQYQPRVGGIA
jgi:hypothetical protein